MTDSEWRTVRINKEIRKDLQRMKLELELTSLNEVLRLLLDTYRESMGSHASHASSSSTPAPKEGSES